MFRSHSPCFPPAETTGCVWVLPVPLAPGWAPDTAGRLPWCPEEQVHLSGSVPPHGVCAMETWTGAGQPEGAGGRGGEEEPAAPGSRAHHDLAARIHGPPAGDLRAEEPGEEPAAGACDPPAEQSLFPRGSDSLLFFVLPFFFFINHSVVSEHGVWMYLSEIFPRTYLASSRKYIFTHESHN